MLCEILCAISNANTNSNAISSTNINAYDSSLDESRAGSRERSVVSDVVRKRPKNTTSLTHDLGRLHPSVQLALSLMV